MRLAFAVVMVLSSISIAAHADEWDQKIQSGGAGESCRARSDCKQGLKCVNQVCSKEGSAAPGGSGYDDEKKSVSSKDLKEWLSFELKGVHPYAGLTWGGGFWTGGLTGSGAGGGFNQLNGDFLFALNGGVFIDNHQVGIEIAPVTYFWTLQRGSPGPAFEVTGSYAYFIPLYESESVKVFWPLRFGIGMMAAPDRNLGGLAFFQPRADVVGAAIQVGHFMIDMHLPSFRYAVTDSRGSQLHFLSWIFGASISYLF